MKKLYIFLILLFAGAQSYAQFAYSAGNTSIVSGIYTDLGATGNAINTSAAGGALTYDDDHSSAQPIGFNFVFNGTTFTQFILNTNGFIKLGADTSFRDVYDVLGEATAVNVLAPLNYDLVGDLNSDYRVSTTGAAGSQVCTIQFKNVRDYATGTGQFSSMNFQIKLYETTNNIEFVYGTFTATSAAAAFIPTVVGIKGGDATTSVNVTKSSATPWNTATFINGDYTGNKFNIRNNILPTSGVTYRFTSVALPAIDAQVSNITTLGKIAIGYNAPHNITAVIKNGGTTALNNLVVTLTITGANPYTTTQTVNVPVGGSTTVTFTGYNPTTEGISIMTVSVPADDVITNNTAAAEQEASLTAMNYADFSAPSGSVGYNTGAGLILNKYRINGTGTISNVRVRISGSAANIGNQVFGVVLNSAGAIVGRSVNRTIAAADTGTYVNFAIAGVSPNVPTFTDTIFYVGLGQVANAAAGYFPVAYQPEGPPLRSGAYYTAPLAGGAAPTENSTIGRFMIEAVMSSPLPVDFISFNAKLESNIVAVSWKTSNEINNKNFEVQRSINGTSFETIGTVEASTTSVNEKVYGFNDVNIKTLKVATIYYRLKQVDKDGKFKLTNVIPVRLSKPNQLLISSVYPNPTKTDVRLIVTTPNNNQVSIMITDLSGKVVAQQTARLVSGDNNLTLNVANLSSGTYAIKVIADNNIAITKFIKE